MTRENRTDSFRQQAWPGTLVTFFGAIVLVAGLTSLHAVSQSSSSSASQAVGEALPPQAGSQKQGGDLKQDGSEKRPNSSTPRGAMELYLAACREGNFEKASHYLELDSTGLEPGSQRAASLARQFDVVLNQKLWIDVDRLSGDRQGDLDDGTTGRDRLGTIETDRGPVDITLSRVDSDTGVAVWRISASTVDKVRYLYEQFGYGPLGEYLPEPFFTISLLDVQIWQWVGILLLLLVAYLLSWIAVALLTYTLRPAARRTKTPIDNQVLERCAAPARLLVAAVLFSAGSLVLHLALPAERLLSQIEKAAIVAATTWIMMRLVDVFAVAVKKRLRREDHRAGLAVVPMGRRSMKVLVAGLAGIAIMQTLGFNVTGIIASLGIGGLAVALAAQRSLENMFAGLSLISDQPVRVGDFCRFGDQLGWVEDIGLRSTRIRTLERSVVAVPNSEFAKLQLDNLAKRDYIRFYEVLGLRYETTADQLRYVIMKLRTLLVSHPKVSLEPFWRVRFIGFGDFALQVEIYAYVRTTDYSEFRAIQEDLLLRTIDIVEEAGTAVAFPSQTTYLGRDHGLDEERSQKAGDAVSGMRDNDELPFPELPADRLEEMSDSLSYPPRGAIEAATR